MSKRPSSGSKKPLGPDLDHWIRPEVAAMDAYKPIEPYDVLSQRLRIPAPKITKLDANENLYGPSPHVRRMLAELDQVHIYPDSQSRFLRRALAAQEQLSEASILIGAGADELIDLVLRVVLTPGDVVVTCPPTFGMYAHCATINGGQLLAVPLQPDFSLDVMGLQRAVEKHPDCKVLFLCSPNNPDGGIVSDRDLQDLLDLPLLVVLDEAYIDFAADPAGRISWVETCDNLVVLRTFSKAAGLAGLRVGYGVFPLWLAPHLWKIKQPYNVNVVAESAALAALADKKHRKAIRQEIRQERTRLTSQLRRFPALNPFPSQANYILCAVSGPDARELKLALEREGVLVRHFEQPAVSDCLRITVGRPNDNDRLLEALRRHLKETVSETEEQDDG